MKTHAMDAGAVTRPPQALPPVKVGPSNDGAEEFEERLAVKPPSATAPSSAPDLEPRGGRWLREEAAAAFLDLETVQELRDLCNQSLPRRKCSRVIDKRDLEPLGRGKYRVFCCKPDTSGNRRPRIHDREA